jgi:pimeloyl-ACP methyl ester carboxylesterase
MDLPPFETGFLTEPDGARLPYVRIGTGSIATIVVPGAADGLRTCVQVALYLAWFYRQRAERYRILILSRRDPLPADYSLERQADDMIRATEQLGFGPAVWECLSAAGPLGQWIAVKRPDLVQGLVLSSSYDYVAPRTRKVMQQWMNVAAHQAGIEAFSDALEQKYRPPAQVLSQLDPALLPPAVSPPDAVRLTRILEPLLDLDQRALTPRIRCPTLVIGGAQDRVVPPEVQREMAARIPGCSLQLCDGFGHFNDMENPDYQHHIDKFAERLGLPAAP